MSARDFAGDKRRLRAEALAVRRALAPEAVAEKSAAIHARLRALDSFAAARALLCYAASKDNEVDTLPILRALLAAARPVFVPVAEPGGRMRWSRLEAPGELVPARFGILEPPPARQRFEPFPAPSICLVPGLAFTRDGFRLGYGGGYYDRFLAGYGGVTVGLAYACQLRAALPCAPHDVPMRYVLTEDGLAG